jgi:hypothetical protein
MTRRWRKPTGVVLQDVTAIPLGRARLLPSRTTLSWEGEAPAEPCDPIPKGENSRPYARSSDLTGVRLSRSFALPNGEAPDDPRDSAACFVNTYGNAICSCARDFALIQKKDPLTRVTEFTSRNCVEHVSR